MAIKPGGFFTHATNATFVTAGLAFGQPTKVPIPIPAEGFIPDQETIPEYLNHILNAVGEYTVWLNAGSSAGAADAHLVETDANGDTTIQDLACVEIATTGDIEAGADLGVAGYIRQGWTEITWNMHQVLLADWPAAILPIPWSQNAVISGAILNVAPPVAAITTDGTTNLGSFGPAMQALSFDPNRGFVFEIVFRVTSVVTDLWISIGIDNGALPMTFTENGVALLFDTDAGDTFWTLAGADTATLTRSASSVAPVQNVWHKFRIEVFTDGSAEMWIDDVSEATLTAGQVGLADPTLQYNTFLTGRIAAARSIELERLTLWQPANA